MLITASDKEDSLVSPQQVSSLIMPTAEGTTKANIVEVDGKPCGPCSDFRDLRRKLPKAGKKSKATAATAGVAAAAAATSSSTSSYEPFPCPADSPTLGNATWTFLHTMAAYYPPKPTQTEQTLMQQFLTSFSRFYPCSPCAEHLRNVMEVNPPDVSGAEGLSKWFCGVHNEVNEMLGKEKFDCSRVFERWRDGRKECFE
ncbi:hypothetical protein HDV00_002574 [Rhizophlyctis rosea]|nr:hypothetical protein HDV00_002574 [Rhizophlyctis rosea]